MPEPEKDFVDVLRGDADARVPYLAANSGEVSDDREVSDLMTEGQLEVLRQLGQQLSNKGIANRLDFTEATVKLHVSATMRALGVRNRTEGVMAAERSGLLGD